MGAPGSRSSVACHAHCLAGLAARARALRACSSRRPLGCGPCRAARVARRGLAPRRSAASQRPARRRRRAPSRAREPSAPAAEAAPVRGRGRERDGLAGRDGRRSEHGGSAADAAVAGVLTIGVTQPVSSGIGGGGFALVWDAEDQGVTALDFRETAPIGIRPREHGKRPPPDKKRGVMTGVPGEIAGLAELHARWGKLAVRRRSCAPPPTWPRSGFPLSAHMARALKWNERGSRPDAALRALSARAAGSPRRATSSRTPRSRRRCAASPPRGRAPSTRARSPRTSSDRARRRQPDESARI